MAPKIVLITGMSGSGKSVALHALEDAGYYCVDNLPPELLPAFVALEPRHHGNRVAIAMDVRSATSLHQVPRELDRLRRQGAAVQSIFLDASVDTLVRRFSETRRRHPLSHDDPQQGRKALVQTIELERGLLADLREQAHVIDTSALRASQLQSYVKGLIPGAQGQLTLVFQSFAFKRGIPMDSDYVFDVRMLPNPHYEPTLRDLTGLDEPVAEFLRQQPDAALMRTHIEQFLGHWLEMLDRNHRSYVTVAIGCTGGQHRSVYLVERLAETFGRRWTALRRHRELDGR
ncbi:RNase adapter RapZ [Verminephrobacter aporrectodeae]|uniref:RNase adapter RapZ n=2 Tax=Verminephrobacter TaxID=364316 RepID=A0ABT3KU17_9BURK|nr:RNase adapter RapZ [Verminephrobacter aporrectodeae]MCW5222563.1 RNase adapter RapZ [Verminephrobacter aporrectodeae subsp. tuberculatae]MCW5257227.1 RNase adapter RapZ [Verminephrobacter aporrectodeae subsp. tuberculatae]MCW5288028.1 RNase adapter RapZ [Verminephrobacter aporrectodeae subsp. tuberculatae]MCW5321592.1 RNase adapter RapZ [Verminephrobacter aporrectodeae subsp. tuberculatae]MCW8163501.1 RNase adapter RapZ [Verminephrobacter aporrectodeae subsp. tuberculatae]